MSVRTWLPLIALVCCVFLLNFSEFAPIGLLTDISKDFGISESTTGLIISVYAWAVAILSLPLMLLLRRMQYRPMLLMCIALFVVFQVITGLSNSYGMLMVSRLGVAVSHSIFWSIATPLAVAVVPMEYRKLAISAVAAGTSIAMIVGLPLGRIIGLALGWRMTFVFIAVIAMIALVFLIAVFPKVENPGTFTLRKLPTILKNPVLIGIYTTLILLVTGYYTGYSYIEPFLGTTAGLSETMITIVLTVFGLAGIVGSAAFTKLYDVVGFRFVIISLRGAGLPACPAPLRRIRTRPDDHLRRMGILRHRVQHRLPERGAEGSPFGRLSGGHGIVLRPVQRRYRDGIDHRRCRDRQHLHRRHRPRRCCIRGLRPHHRIPLPRSQGRCEPCRMIRSWKPDPFLQSFILEQLFTYSSEQP